MKRRDNTKDAKVEINLDLPTLYNYYTENGNVTCGLSADQSYYFTLNNKQITIISGTIHYFRVPQEYWRDRLKKMRAAGLNAIETYVPWNLHEPQPGIFDFGHGESDFEKFLDISKFLRTAQEEDLLVIVRPGPYICSEWEFGGLPSWLLREKDMKIRTSDRIFMEHVRMYFTALLEILSEFQFTKGGPIIAFQIENEYGNTKEEDKSIDTDYMKKLKELMISLGVVELLFTSDTPSNGNWGSLPDTLITANFQNKPDAELNLLREYQPDKPLMVMEYWTGWFDHWTEKHHTRTAKEFSDVYESILKFPASVNMYMFHGGSSWGFMNGANLDDDGAYQPDTNSYDYDAPLNEAGDYTDKYYSVQKLNEKYNEIKTLLPFPPPATVKIAYDEIKITEQLTINELINNAELHIEKHNLLPMEMLPINNNAGQSYGYIVYRKKNLTIPPNSYLKIEGRVCDTVMVLIDGKLKTKLLRTQDDLEKFGYWKLKDGLLNLEDKVYNDATLDIIIENSGRVNYGKLHQFNQKKGLWQGNVSVNGVNLYDWEMIPLEFKKNWVNNLKGWHNPTFEYGPAIYKGILKIARVRNDSYIYMGAWTKGIVIINGFVLSRYLKFGPQQTVYLPGPFLKDGDNEILIFEHFIPTTTINFVANPIYANTA